MTRDGPFDPAGHQFDVLCRSPRIADLVARSNVDLVSHIVNHAAVVEHLFDARDTSLERQQPHEARYVECRPGETLCLNQFAYAEVMRQPRGCQRVKQSLSLETATGRDYFVDGLFRGPDLGAESAPSPVCTGM